MKKKLESRSVSSSRIIAFCSSLKTKSRPVCTRLARPRLVLEYILYTWQFQAHCIVKYFPYGLTFGDVLLALGTIGDYV